MDALGRNDTARRIVLAEYPQVVTGIQEAANRWRQDEIGDTDVLGNLARTVIIAIASYFLGPVAWAALGDMWSGVAFEAVNSTAEFVAERAAEVAAQAGAESAAAAVVDSGAVQAGVDAAESISQYTLQETVAEATATNTAIASAADIAVQNAAIQAGVDAASQLSTYSLQQTAAEAAITNAQIETAAALTGTALPALSLPALPAGTASALAPLLKGILSTGAQPVAGNAGYFRLPDGRIVPYTAFGDVNGGAVDGFTAIGDNKGLLLAGAGLLALIALKPERKSGKSRKGTRNA